MNVSLRAAVFAAVAVLQLQAQVAVDPHAALPGTVPGTQRWIVTFAPRALDLEPLRAAIRGGAPASTVATIVADLDARAAASHAAFTAVVATLGGTTTHHWWIIDGCAVEVRPEHVAALRAHPGVAGVFPDSLRSPAGVELIKDATNGRNHNSDLVNLFGFNGAGVTVAVLDSGCDENMGGSGRPHATFFVNGDINNRTGGGIGGSRLLVNRQMGAQPADDIIAHGTAVTACAAGQVWPTPAGDPGQAPAARIASYCMADLTNGAASLTTMVATWQRVAAEASSLGIRVANLSYEGSTPVNWPEQTAMDAAAQVADLAVAVMGGNGGSSTHYSHGALNVLAVGSVAKDVRVVSPFSSRGPLEDNLQRFFPDVVANGESLRMPQADNEGVDRIASGTSYSSAQVAGAMTIYRGVRAAATSLETRAAVLASAEAIGEQNREVTFHTRNAYGLGYLRTDRLVQLALDPNTTSVTLTLGPQQPNQRLRYRVTAGRWYVAALAWNRQNDSNLDWSNLDLSVSFQGGSLGVSATPQNVHERVVFKAPADGFADIDIRGISFESSQTAVACGVVIGAGTPAYVEGAVTPFGTTCGPAVDATVPSLGTTYTVATRMATSSPIGVLLLGASDRTWGTITLPLPLSAFGAPGCYLNVSPDLLTTFPMLGGAGIASIAVPSAPELLGATYFHQVVVPVTTNPLQAVFSRGLRMRIAGFQR